MLKATDITKELIIVIGMFLMWEGVVSLFKIPSTVMPSPISVAEVLAKDRRLLLATLTTLSVFMQGFPIGCFLGIALGILASFTRFGGRIANRWSGVFAGVPALALVPFLVRWSGYSERTIVIVVIYCSMFPMIMITHGALLGVSSTTRKFVENLGLSKWRQNVDVLIPAALPGILPNLPIVSIWAFKAIIGAELYLGAVGSAGGLGWYLNEESSFARTADMVAALVMIMVLITIVNWSLRLIERQTIWKWGLMRQSH